MKPSRMVILGFIAAVPLLGACAGPQKSGGIVKPASVLPSPMTESTPTTAAPTRITSRPTTSTTIRVAITTTTLTATPATAPSSVSYANCTAVRAAGKAPLYRGDPGYAPKLDRDNDGVACE